MEKIDLRKLYKTQISLTEWLEKAGLEDVEAMRIEDNDKRERMKILHEAIGLPFDRPVQFTASEVADRTAAFEEYLAEHGGELCAMRLIPLDPSLPKLRMRGQTVREALGWFSEQGVDPVKYRVDFVPHPRDHAWSTIFVVNDHGIFGEVIAGSLNQLSQGFHDEGTPIPFAYDFREWRMGAADQGVLAHLQKAIAMLHVKDGSVRDKLSSELDAGFSRQYLRGYFETTESREFGIWFVDYNRMLGDVYADFGGALPATNAGAAVGARTPVVRGACGSPGRATGPVRVVAADAITASGFEGGDVLVCKMTTPEYIPHMRKASAIITEYGGILCHATIVARELGKPCIVGAKGATTILKDGDKVEADASGGVVYLLNEDGTRS